MIDDDDCRSRGPEKCRHYHHCRRLICDHNDHIDHDYANDHHCHDLICDHDMIHSFKIPEISKAYSYKKIWTQPHYLNTQNNKFLGYLLEHTTLYFDPFFDKLYV